LKYESGVHRVQRIPTTESSGRIHTSTASVAILPEAKDLDVTINQEDLYLEVMRASGAGGQCVNKTDSAVRITHIPTGIVVSCQETKHQAQNKEKAMALLRSRLYEMKRLEQQASRSDMRLSQIGTSMRAEKIRTYNFPQNRITDHRIKKSWFALEEILSGNLQEVVDDVKEGIQLQLIENN
jgi:peptide chain release factor 1